MAGAATTDNLERDIERIRRHLKQRRLRIAIISVLALAFAAMWVWALALAMRAEALVKSEELASGSFPVDVALVVYSAAKLQTQVIILSAVLGFIVSIFIAEILNVFSHPHRLLAGTWDALRRVEGELEGLRRASERERTS